MEYLLTAMHVKNNLFGLKLDLTEEMLHETHVVIGHHIVEFNRNNIEDVLEKGFNHFNWQDVKDGYAGDIVNMICRMEDTHASMSVGDCLKVQYKTQLKDGPMVTTTRFFVVANFGFEEIPSHFDNKSERNNG